MFIVAGAESQNRTGDTAIFSRVLYQLSYLGGGGDSNPARLAVSSKAPRAGSYLAPPPREDFVERQPKIRVNTRAGCP